MISVQALKGFAKSSKKRRMNNTNTNTNKDDDVSLPQQFPDLQVQNGIPIYDKSQPSFFTEALPTEKFYDQSANLDFSSFLFNMDRILEDDEKVSETKQVVELYEPGYQPRPLREALEALRIYGLNETWDACEEFLRAKGPLPYGLTYSEAMAISLYCSEIQEKGKKEENIYFRLNKVLRGNNIANKREWRDYIYYLLTGIRKTPRISGKVYRGINKKLTKRYKKGDIIYWNSFTSTMRSSEDEDEAKVKQLVESFGGDKATFFSVAIFNGHNIKELSPFGEDEDEVLLEPCSCFSVLDSIEAFGIVSLRECDPDVPLLLPDPTRCSCDASEAAATTTTARAATGGTLKVRDSSPEFAELCSVFQVFMGSIKPDQFNKDINAMGDLFTLKDFYEGLRYVESAINSSAFVVDWAFHLRDKWLAELDSPVSCDCPHAASCLFSIERCIRVESQVPDWGNCRKDFLSRVAALGGKEILSGLQATMNADGSAKPLPPKKIK